MMILCDGGSRAYHSGAGGTLYEKRESMSLIRTACQRVIRPGVSQNIILIARVGFCMMRPDFLHSGGIVSGAGIASGAVGARAVAEKS
jgi:hypothetical protein